MRDEPIRRSRCKARKNIHLMQRAGKLQFEPLDPCVRRRQTRYQGASLHLFTSKERSLERDNSSEDRQTMYNEQWQLWEQKPYQHKQIRRQHIQWCTDIYMSRRCSGNELSRDNSEVLWYSCKGWRQGLHTRQCLAKRTNQTNLTKESNSDSTNTKHSLRKVYFRTRQSVIWCRCRLVKLHQCYILRN